MCNNSVEAITLSQIVDLLYLQREAALNMGFKLMEAPTRKEKIQGAMLVLKTWFDRSLDASNYSPKHCNFGEYVSMVLWQYNVEKQKPLFSKEIEDILKYKYIPMESKLDGSFFDITKA